MRDLLRFLLEQEGYSVLSESSTAAAAAGAVAEHHPDVVIIHEAAAQDDPDAVGRIHAHAADATLVILTADRSGIPPWLVAAADAVVEEGAGLQDLASVLAAGSGATLGRWTPTPGPRPEARVRGQRWADRLQGAVAAAILMLAVVFATSVQPSSSESLRAAYASLDALAQGLPEASVEDAITMATTLISERAMLKAASVDVTTLDVEIAATINPLLESLSPEVVVVLRELLGDLLAGPSVTPSPTVVTTPEPAVTPGSEESSGPETTPTVPVGPPVLPTGLPPTGTETPSPSPPATETPSPPPTGTETPSPPPTGTETPSPPPTGTETPSPPPTATGTETPSPSPTATGTETPSPSPTATESPSPSPTESPSPSATETPSPSPSESPSPTGTESPSPSAAETTTTDPAPPTAAGEHVADGSGTVALVPPGLVLLLGSSGAARWLRRRRR